MVDPSVAANANVALYCCGIFSALFVAPLTFKYLGNYSMFVGGFTYVLYMGSLWAYGVCITFSPTVIYSLMRTDIFMMT
jgi:hypothetical protein